MLHEDCPTIGMVVECGFNRGDTFATDIFPMRISFDPKYSDPFGIFPEFVDFFLTQRLAHILQGTGAVLLLLGCIAFDNAKVLSLPNHAWEKQDAFEHLHIYLETYWVRSPICKY